MVLPPPADGMNLATSYEWYKGGNREEIFSIYCLCLAYSGLYFL
jgi:hypothetical protein